uniref:Glucagon / GIP / secretin / VIP family domain-containing protein n=1 Tax=Denticeps clupeoides TaxID=299321 RepID=A0AAY4CUU0_9TELE
MTGFHSLTGLLLLVLLQSSRQVPVLPDEGDVSSTEPQAVPHMKRHSEGTFSNDYSKYLENRRAQDFVQWLMNSNRGEPSRRHADGTFTSDVSSYLQDQAAKDFISWLKTGAAKKEPVELRRDSAVRRRHVDGSFTSDVNQVLDSIAAKQYLLWVMNSKPPQTSNKRDGDQ